MLQDNFFIIAALLCSDTKCYPLVPVVIMQQQVTQLHMYQYQQLYQLATQEYNTKDCNWFMLASYKCISK